MQFGLWTRVGGRNHVLDVGRDPPCEGHFSAGRYLHGKRLDKEQPKDQERQFFYDGIRALEKRRTKCISVAGNYVEK